MYNVNEYSVLWNNKFIARVKRRSHTYLFFESVEHFFSLAEGVLRFREMDTSLTLRVECSLTYTLLNLYLQSNVQMYLAKRIDACSRMHIGMWWNALMSAAHCTMHGQKCMAECIYVAECYVLRKALTVHMYAYICCGMHRCM
jgi:hypothetical protein